MSNIDIDTNDDHFEQVWRDKGIILRCDACLQPLNTQTVRGCLMDVSNSTSAPTCTCTHTIYSTEMLCFVLLFSYN